MRVLALLLAAAALAACGADEPAAPVTDLVVRVDADGAQGPQAAREAHVHCPGKGCGVTAADFAPAPRHQACTEVYGGPETATVTGTLNGEPVDARFRRTDGCEIARWHRVRGLLAAATG